MKPQQRRSKMEKEEADDWISVKDRLPEKDEFIVMKGDFPYELTGFF